MGCSAPQRFLPRQECSDSLSPGWCEDDTLGNVMERSNQPGQTPHRPALGGLSALFLLALTVQLSVSMLEWAGPASIETRTRLATTIVAAAHRGVFTEPDRPVGGIVCEEARSIRPVRGLLLQLAPQTCGTVSMAVSPWSTCLAPPQV